MLKTLRHLVGTPKATQPSVLPDLAPHSRGLPALSSRPCNGCGACEAACPSGAVTMRIDGPAEGVTLDLGRCIACGACIAACPTGTIERNLSTRVATTTRDRLVQSTHKPLTDPVPSIDNRNPFQRSLHVREVSTGDNATDLEVSACNNAIFDSSRFGIHFVASPRHADALLVTGPVGLAMQEPLRRCYEAMPEPRLVIACGAAAISGGLHAGGYATANGVDAVLPVDVYIPGGPPHPWYVLHGLLIAMGWDRS